MSESHVSLTVEEHDFLVDLLESELKEKRVEEHRTRAPSYRQLVLHEEDVISSLLGKLKQPVG